MRLGIRLHDVAGDTFEEKISNAAEQGYDSIQLAIYKAIKPEEFSTEKTALTPGLARHIRRIMDKHGIDCAVLGCYKILGIPDREAVADTIDTYKRFIRFSSYLGAGLVGTETGGGDRQHRILSYRTEESLASYIKDLKEVVDYAEKMGVVVAIEPVCVHIVGTIAETRRVLDEINSPNLQIIFDPVGLIEGANYKDRVNIWKEFLDVCGKEIAAVHLKDFKIVDGELVNCPIGRGIMEKSEYEMIVNWMKKEKPYIDMLLEDSVPETAPGNCDFLRAIEEEC